jgi:CrcB protein
MMLKILLIAAGGAAGTLARYGTAEAMHRFTTRAGFPLGTLAVNLLGCLLIGVLNGLFVDRLALRPEYRLMLVAGFLGGFTTFSAFGLETAMMLREGHYARAIGYVTASNVLGVGLVAVGYALARQPGN